MIECSLSVCQVGEQWGWDDARYGNDIPRDKIGMSVEVIELISLDASWVANKNAFGSFSSEFGSILLKGGGCKAKAS